MEQSQPTTPATVTEQLPTVTPDPDYLELCAAYEVDERELKNWVSIFS